MNLQYSSSKILRVEGLGTLDEEAIVFSRDNLMEEDKEEEEEEDSCVEGSRLLERLGFAKSEEAEGMVNVEKG